MKKLLLIILVLCNIGAMAQSHDYSRSRCLEYHKNNCETSTNKYYRINSKSRSGLFHKGQKSKTLLEAFNGRDYRISICHDDVFTKPVIFRIVDKDRDKVLYDNSEDNYAQEFEFTVTATVELYVEVEIQGDSPLKKKNNNPLIKRDSEVGCVGVLIEYMVTPRKGF